LRIQRHTGSPGRAVLYLCLLGCDIPSRQRSNSGLGRVPNQGKLLNLYYARGPQGLAAGEGRQAAARQVTRRRVPSPATGGPSPLEHN
jgi:hypothetical protein